MWFSPSVGEGLAVARVDRDRLAHHLDDVLVAVLPFGEFADDLKNFAYSGFSSKTFFFAAAKPGRIVGEEAHGGPHREQLEIDRVRLQAFVGGLVGSSDVQIAEGEPGADEVRLRKLWIHLERLIDLALGALEIEAVVEQHSSLLDVRVRVLRRDLERVFQGCGGVARVVAIQKVVRLPKERLHQLRRAGAIGLFQCFVRVLEIAEQIRGAPDHREPERVGRLEAIEVVVVDDRHQRRVRRVALAGLDEQLAEDEPGVARAVVALDLAASGDRLLHPAGFGERLGAERGGLVLQGSPVAGCLFCLGDRFVVVTGHEEKPSFGETGLARAAAPHARELLLGEGVVAVRNGRARAGKRGVVRRARVGETAESTKAARPPKKPPSRVRFRMRIRSMLRRGPRSQAPRRPHCPFQTQKSPIEKWKAPKSSQVARRSRLMP